MSLLMGSNELRAQEHYDLMDGNPQWVYYLQANKGCNDPFLYIKVASMQISYSHDCFVRIYFDTPIDLLPNLTPLYCEVLDIYGNKLSKKNIGVDNPILLAFCRISGDKVLGGLRFVDYRFTNHSKRTYTESDFYDNTLLFDYGLNVGDTLYMGGEPERDSAKYLFPVIDKQLWKMADGNSRYMTTYSLCEQHPSFNKELYSIEGIGFINAVEAPFGLLYNDSRDLKNTLLNKRVCYHWWNLNCFIQNGKVVYIAPREGFENDEEYEGSTRFKEMPFYPDITPESVADGTYTLPATVDGIADNKTSKGKQIYNLQGQKTNGLQRGINIVGGKKVIVK